jgi:hypothetical protein
MTHQKIKHLLVWSVIGLVIVAATAWGALKLYAPTPPITPTPPVATAPTAEAPLTELEKSFQCPNDYASPQAYVNAAAKFVHDFDQIFPNSAAADVLEYRQQLLESHQCEPSKWL